MNPVISAKPNNIRLTQYSHGAGCGCKIAPVVLNSILAECRTDSSDPWLLVGNNTSDDAAVYEIDNEKVIISTTDFFMPVVDDPHDFGAIASINAIGDIYAMGGMPVMAVAILCWPLNILPASIAGQVLKGARDACAKEGITIAGGHSIDGPEPIFGLAVTGMAEKRHIRRNSTAEPDCELYLTKPLGVGILTTAMKKGVLSGNDRETMLGVMLKSNSIGKELGKLNCVKAMTDVTGFGLLGHLIEMCEGSGLSAEIEFNRIPAIKNLEEYISQNTIPGGTFRNFDSYGHKVSQLTQRQKLLLCDPQTSGGLLVAVDPERKYDFMDKAADFHLTPVPFGRLKPSGDFVVEVKP